MVATPTVLCVKHVLTARERTDVVEAAFLFVLLELRLVLTCSWTHPFGNLKDIFC